MPALVSKTVKTECWVHKTQAGRITSAAIESLRSALAGKKADDPLLGPTEPERLYRMGTEVGLLGIDETKWRVYAVDGSLDDGVMGAGATIRVSDAQRLSCKIGRRAEGASSTRAELG